MLSESDLLATNIKYAHNLFTVKKTTTPFSIQKLPKVVRENLQVVIIGFILVVLLIGTVVAVQLSQQTQETRQSASVATGVVVASVTAPDPLIAGQPGSITFSINTHSASIIGIQLMFHIEGVDTPPVITAIPGSGLSVTDPTPSASGSGYDVLFGGLATPGGPGVNTVENTVPFASFAFTTSTTQSAVTVTFDQAQSSALDLVGAEQLSTVQNASFPITPVATNTPIVLDTATPTITPPDFTASPTPIDFSPSPTFTQTPTLTPEQATNTPTSTPIVLATDTPAPTDVPTNTPVPTATLIAIIPTNTPTTTPENGTGGTIIKYCGESCTKHTDCAVNLLCYSGVCRLANNPTDTYCSDPPDNGIHRSCDEYCADSRECNTGLTCYYNRCRNPRNLSDQYCSEPIAYRTETKVETKTITKEVIVTATPDPFASEENTANEMIAEVTEPLAYSTNTPWPTYAPVTETTPEPQQEEPTLVEKIQGWLKGLLIVAIAISAVFFLLWLLPLFLKKRNDDDDDQPPMTGTTGTGTTTYSSPYSSSLKEKTESDSSSSL